MSCLNSEKVWEVMNDLESSFNEITTLSGLIEFIEESLQSNNTQQAKEGVEAMKSFMKVYLAKYDKASRRAWNNTVTKLREHQHSYDYEEISDFLNHENEMIYQK